jgi:hypothetical protein
MMESLRMYDGRVGNIVLFFKSDSPSSRRKDWEERHHSFFVLLVI